MQPPSNSGNPVQWKYGDITSQIIGTAMEVHRELGPGFQEFVYSRARSIEFSLRGLKAEAEFPMQVFYKDVCLTTRRVDFLIEGVIPTELKAVSNLENEHLVQALNYLESWRAETGLLINFGAASLQFKRLFNKKLKPRAAAE